MRNKILNCVILLSIVITFSCRHSVNRQVNLKDGRQYSQPEYAERFLLEKKDGYTRLVIMNPWQGAMDITQEYFLVKKGKEVPVGIDRNKVIFTPVERIICLSTTHIAMINALNSQSTIVAVSGAQYIYNSEIKLIADSGLIKDVGYEDNLNKEMILELNPDLVMVYGIGSESAGYLGKLNELGVRILFNADYLEKDPLGKAEWIKVIGSLYCKEAESDSLFNKISEEYNELKSFILGNIKNKPSVLLGLPWKDTWYISPGNSYISKLISDAGGNYLWSGSKSDVSMPYGLENVFLRALNADYWINIGSIISKEEIIATDSRLGELPAFKNGKLFNNNNRLNSSGGNDYWESGSINPQFILHDLAIILHPELSIGNDLHYYKKVK